MDRNNNKLHELNFRFTDDAIYHPDGRIIMHEWERPLMKKIAEFVCENGGHILELGFGMGISADYIQKQDIETHTVYEVNPEVYENALIWSKDKSNVKIIQKDWFEDMDDWPIFDGILFDTYQDDWTPLIFNIGKFSRKGTKLYLFFWGESDQPIEFLEGRFSSIDIEKVDVDPNPNDYHNKNYFYLHKITV
jgi:hypothetical protein